VAFHAPDSVEGNALVILEANARRISDACIVTTDDGSYGRRGLVTEALADAVASAVAPFDEVVAVGPLPMMRAVCELTRRLGIKTTVSLNPVMVDGTGMCGGCRVTIGGEQKFVCVDGPEFDGHQVDFAELMARLGAYREQEAAACAPRKINVRSRARSACGSSRSPSAGWNGSSRTMPPEPASTRSRNRPRPRRRATAWRWSGRDRRA
jgi:hypothetical protein